MGEGPVGFSPCKEAVLIKFSKAGFSLESLQTPADARESCCQAEQRRRSLPWSRRGREVQFQASAAPAASAESLKSPSPAAPQA